MRNLSVVLTLLFACAMLPAQTATSNNPTILILPPRVSSCPVRLSVDRQPYFSTLWTSSKGDWIKSHDQTSLLDLERALKNEPGFGEMSPQAYQARLDRRLKADNRQHGEGLVINFNGPQTQIVSANIVVHGYLASSHIIPATFSTPKDMIETFHLAASAGEPLLQSSIWTQPLMMVNWVELTRLEYADGTTWRPSAPRQCYAAPSLYLAVGAPR